MSEHVTSSEPLRMSLVAEQEAAPAATPAATGPVRPEPKGGLSLYLPVLPARGTVLYPRLPLPVAIGRERSIAAIQAALASEDKTLVVVSQRDAATDEPTRDELFAVGTLAVVKHMMRTAEGVRVLLIGIGRIAIDAIDQEEPYRRARVRTLPPPTDDGPEVEAHRRILVDLSRRALEILQPEGSGELSRLLDQTTDALQLAYMMAHLLPLDLARAQSILEAPTRLEALRILEEYLREEIQVLEIRKEIGGKAANEMSRSQREYLLRMQRDAINKELGEDEAGSADAAALKARLDETDVPEAVREEATRELKRLERLPAAAPDYQVIRSYLELVLELPWKEPEPKAIDLESTRQVLDEDHFGLQEVKERILDGLAVMKLNPGARAPILCFVGPPGVGKTSLGQSIAKALGRMFERLSLGGMHDESELRGHRRTYIGAMPGRILQAVRRAKVKDPVIMLDEIDKLSKGFHGDPASALLEILDPAQNHAFRDNYLDLPYDLSHVFFITTANALDPIPAPLLDRMEILRLSGYTPEEKMTIARTHLIPRRLAEAGLAPDQFRLTDQGLARIIARYTREAGVRELDRVLTRLAQKVARSVAEGATEIPPIESDNLSDRLGDERFMPEEARPTLPPGVTTGLAWTESGGDVLYVEASLLPNSKELRMTGSLGEVMRESATAAQTFVWSHASDLGFDPTVLTQSGVHFHVPAGAVPKDGPSAGLALVTALVSLCRGVPARRDTAMTGEISLTGLVLPVGGIKEKLLAAHRAGLRRALLPRANERDINKLPEATRKEMEIHFVDHIDDAIALALTPPALPQADGQEVRA